MKKIFLLITIVFFTMSLAFGQWQIEEGFESGTIPAEWTTSTWGVYSTSGYPHTGTYLAASDGGNDWLITPQVYIQSGDSFIFWARAWAGTESFNVMLSTSGTATSNFTTTLASYTSVNNTWIEYTIPLSDYTGSAYLAIEVEPGGDYILALDDVMIGQTPVSCPAPSYLEVTNIQANQADFGWTENGSATTWNIEVGATGFIPGTSAYIQAYSGVTSNPYTGTGLTASNHYDVYVQADNGGGDVSTWAGPVSFSNYIGVLSTGDIAFTAFNADGDDDFAIVALVDIPANTFIYFTDNEPNADGSGFADYNEGTLLWDSGAAVISAGTVVIFTDTDNTSNSGFGVSIGTISLPSFNGVMALSTSGDALYAVEGNPDEGAISAWLAGIQNETGNQGDNFGATGLTVGSTFFDMYEGTASPDGGAYNGDRVGQTLFSDYLPLLTDYANWTIEISNGENILPISNSSFMLAGGPENPAAFSATSISISEIDLAWTQNAAGNNVLIAWSADGSFGTPTDGTVYSAGNAITGGGTVIYYGSDLSFDHTGLNDNTTYYYKAWSYDGSEYSFGITDNATTNYIPYTADFSDNFDSETPPALPANWSCLEVSSSTIGFVETSTTASYSAPNNVRMYKYYAVDDLMLITPQLGDLTSHGVQIRFMARASGFAQDLIVGTMSDPTDAATFHPYETISITEFNTYAEYTVVFDVSYTLDDQYIAFKQGSSENFSYMNIDDFVYEHIPGLVPTAPTAITATTNGTRTFSANWMASVNATGYYLDVATDEAFTTFVPGYENLDVGNVTTYSVTAQNVVTHYYRLSAYNTFGTSAESNIITVFDSTLPVVLSTFTGICEDGSPQLSWTTQSEMENLGWNVYRSNEENGYEEENVIMLNATLIAGQGTTSEPTTYNYTDSYDPVTNATYWYWLQSISYSGELELYGPVSILVEEEEAPPVVVPELPKVTTLKANFPNPFNPTTTIEFDIKEGESGRLTIYNVLGQKVMEHVYQEGFHTFVWNADQQASGVYFYSLKTSSYSELKKMLLLK